MYVDAEMIWKVLPIWSVKGKNGQLWRSCRGFPSAEIVSYRLIDKTGTEYTCADHGELAKLGLDVGRPQPKIGFVNVEDSEEKESVDLGQQAVQSTNGSDAPGCSGA